MVKIHKFKKRHSNSRTIVITLLISVVIGVAVGVYSPKRETPQESAAQENNQPITDTNCLFGCPEGNTDNRVIKRQIYTLSNNATTKFADWVSYHITSRTIGPSKSRNWKADPDLLPENTLEPDDYKNANAVLKTDRGHQAPLAAFSGTDYWHLTNYLSNITPQKSNLNQGSWVRLENAVREAANNNQGLYIVTGPLYEDRMEQLPEADEGHNVPSGYWKVVVNEIGGLRAFIFDQNLPRSANYCDQTVSLDEVEQRAGLDLFPEIPNRDAEKDKLSLGCD